ncbi:26592_t:CDS:1, partial [Racocetra persica]
LSDYPTLFDEFINNTEWDIIPQPIELTAEKLNIQKGPNENLITDQQNINQQKNKYFIEQIRNDLEHKIKNQVQLNSSYQ